MPLIMVVNLEGTSEHKVWMMVGEEKEQDSPPMYQVWTMCGEMES